MEVNDNMSGVDRFFEALDKMVGEWLHGQEWFRFLAKEISGVDIPAPVTEKSDVMVDYPYDLPPVGECTTEEVPVISVFVDPDSIRDVPVPALGTLEELTREWRGRS